MRVITDLREFDMKPWHVRVVHLVTAALFLWLLTAILPGCTRVVYRDAPQTPTPVVSASPPPSPCRFPQGLTYTTHPGIPTLHDRLNTAMSKVLDCPVWSECRYPTYDPQDFYRALTHELQASGLCAAQPVIGQSDEIAVGLTECGDYEIFHAWHYERGPIWAKSRSTPCVGTSCGNPYRGNARPDRCS